MAGCPDCGIDESDIVVTDAVAAVRGFPRRYRAALEAAGEAHESAVARGELARLVPELEAATVALAAALGRPRPAPPHGTDLDALDAVVEEFSALADGAPWPAWDRTTVVDGETRSGHEIAAHAAHLGAHHLRAIRRAVPDAG
jgi:hypothetical protein